MRIIVISLVLLSSCLKNDIQSQQPKLIQKSKPTVSKSVEVVASPEQSVKTETSQEVIIVPEETKKDQFLDLESISNEVFKDKKGIYLEIPKETSVIQINYFKTLKFIISEGKFLIENNEICEGSKDECKIQMDYFRTEYNLEKKNRESIFMKIDGVSLNREPSFYTLIKGEEARFELPECSKYGEPFFVHELNGSVESKIISACKDNFLNVSSKFLALSSKNISHTPTEADLRQLPIGYPWNPFSYYGLKGNFLWVNYKDDKDFYFYESSDLKGNEIVLDRSGILFNDGKKCLFETKKEVKCHEKIESYELHSYSYQEPLDVQKFIRVYEVASDSSWAKVKLGTKELYLKIDFCKLSTDCSFINIEQTQYEKENERLKITKLRKDNYVFNYLSSKLKPCLESKNLACIGQYFINDSNVFKQNEDEGCMDINVDIPKFSLKPEHIEILKGCLEYENILPNQRASYFKGHYCILAPKHVQAEPATFRFLLITKEHKHFKMNYSRYHDNSESSDKFDLENSYKYSFPFDNRELRGVSNYIDPKRVDKIISDIPAAQEIIRDIGIKPTKLAEDTNFDPWYLELLFEKNYKMKEFLPQSQQKDPYVIKFNEKYGQIYDSLIPYYSEKSQFVHKDFFTNPAFKYVLRDACFKGFTQYDASFLKEDPLLDDFLKELLMKMKEINTFNPKFNNDCSLPGWILGKGEVLDAWKRSHYWQMMLINSLSKIEINPSLISVMASEDFQRGLFKSFPFAIQKIPSDINLHESVLVESLSDEFNPKRFFTSTQLKQTGVKNFLTKFPNTSQESLQKLKSIYRVKYDYKSKEYFLSMPEELLIDPDFHKTGMANDSFGSTYFDELLEYRKPDAKILTMILEVCSSMKKGTINYVPNSLTDIERKIIPNFKEIYDSKCHKKSDYD